MRNQVDVEKVNERFGPGQLDRFLGLRLGRRNLDPPFLAAANQGAIEGKSDKIGQASGRAASSEIISPSR